MRRLFHTITAAFAALCFTQAAPAQNYPVKPVRVIVGTAAGGGTDTQARLLCKRFQESMGQQFVVDNRGGASGVIGTELAVRSPPDGYTILFASAQLATNAILFKKVSFDPLKDLAPVGQVSFAPQFLIVHPSVPARSVTEFVALAKRQPGKLNAGSSGTGTANHLAVEMLKQITGISVIHIPYKGGAPAITALIGGEVDFTFTGAVTALPHVRAGKVRALAVTSATKSSAAPGLPTMGSIYPGFESANWYAMFVPAGTPAAIIARLNAELVNAIKSPEIRDFMTGEGAEPVGGTPQALGAYLRRDIERYGKVIQAGNVRVE